jgi:hypothetical protein
VEELLLTEAELHDVGKTSQSSPGSTEFRWPRATKIIGEIARGKSLKHQLKPWNDTLPKPRISPPRTLGDAVIKNSCIRLRGGRLIPQLLKMALSSTTYESVSNSVQGANSTA